MRKSPTLLNPSSTKSLSGWIINKRPHHREVPAIATEYLAKILTSQVYEAAIETPLTYAPTISSNLKNEIFLKREDMQPVFSFKIRGAYNKIAKLSPQLRAKGVVTCSAGNHAQGVAMSASKLNINAIIVYFYFFLQHVKSSVISINNNLTIFGSWSIFTQAA